MFSRAVVFCILFLLSSALHAIYPEGASPANTVGTKTPVVYTAASGEIAMARHAYYLEDEGGVWGLSEVDGQPRWAPNTSNTLHFGMSDSVIWMKWRVINVSSKGVWLLELGNPLVNSANLYIKRPDSEIEAFITGNEHLFFQRPYQHRNLIFPVYFEKGEVVEFYLRVTSKHILDLPITLWREEQFLKNEIKTTLLGGLFFGMALIIIFYNLFMYFVLSEKSYFFFVLFVLAFVLAYSARSGISYQYWWPNRPIWNQYSLNVFYSLKVIFLSIFFLFWIEAKNRVSEKLLIFSTGIGVALMVASFLFSYYVILWFYWLGLAICLSAALYGSLDQVIDHRVRANRYSLLATIFLASGMFYDFVTTYHLVEVQTLSYMLLPVSGIVFMLLISVALTERIDRERKERLLDQQAALEELSAREEAESNLMHCVLHDGLTGCPNKGLLLSTLQKEMDLLSNSNLGIDVVESQPEKLESNEGGSTSSTSKLAGQQNISLIVVHLKRFKEINNTIGQLYAGELLIMVCRRLCCLVAQLPRVIPIEENESDSRSWVGAIEDATFALICREVDEKNLRNICDKILNTINRPVDYEGMVLDVNGYIGIASYPEHGSSANQLLQRALVALDVAQSKEVLQLIYSNKIDPYSARRLSLAGDLKNALQVDKLELYYQPQVSLRDDEVIGVEALVRWIHPKYGFIPPDEFIVLAEQTGIIRQLTSWVLETAISKLSVWEEEGLDLNISVNLSAKNLGEQDLVDRIELLIDQYGVTSDNLSLEITETAMMSDPAQALVMLNAINAAGIGLSVDDFGIGYSSLAYLKRLPVSELKIDRSFVMDMSKDTDDQVIVNTTLNMSHSLGMTVVAEGVEDKETLNTLRRLGCDIAQGYYICKPAPALAFEQWLRKTDFGVKRKECEGGPDRRMIGGYAAN